MFWQLQPPSPCRSERLCSVDVRCNGGPEGREGGGSSPVWWHTAQPQRGMLCPPRQCTEGQFSYHLPKYRPKGYTSYCPHHSIFFWGGGVWWDSLEKAEQCTSWCRSCFIRFINKGPDLVYFKLYGKIVSKIPNIRRTGIRNIRTYITLQSM